MSTPREKFQHNWKQPHGLIRFTHYYNKKKAKLFCLTAVREAWQGKPEIVELVEIKERTTDEPVTSVDVPLTEFQSYVATGALIKCEIKQIF